MYVLVGTVEGLIGIGSDPPVAFEGHDVVAVAGEWVVLDARRLHRRDGRPGPDLDGPAITCLDARPGEEPLVGTAEAHLYRMGAEATRVHSFDLAEGRGQWYTPWGGPPDARSVCTAPSGTVLVNVHVGGILRSDDGGASWRATLDIDLDVHQVLALGNGAAVAACARGLATSGDDGASWEVGDDGLHATYSRAVAVSGDAVLLSASLGPRGEQAAVYRRPLAGGRFERCQAGLPEWLPGNVDTFWLAGTANGEAAFATGAGEVYVSSDEGATWERAATGLPSPRCLALA